MESRQETYIHSSNLIKSSLKGLIDPQSKAYTFIFVDNAQHSDLATQPDEVLGLIFKNQPNETILGISVSSLKEKITNIANYIFTELTSEQFIKTEDEGTASVFIDKKILDEIRAKTQLELNPNQQIAIIFGKKANITSYQAMGRIYAYLLATRLLIEMKKSNVILPKKSISEQKAKDDYKGLKTFQSNMFSQPKKMTPSITSARKRIAEKIVPFNFRDGNKITDYFTFDERAKASLDEASSYQAIWERKGHELLNELKKQFLEVFRLGQENRVSNYNGSKKKGYHFNSHVIFKALSRNVLVSQYPPTTLIILIAILIEHFDLEIPVDKNGNADATYLDLCMGWLGKMLGALATPFFSKIIGVEANEELTKRAVKGYQFTESKTELITFAKKLEDIPNAQLDPNKKGVHFIHCSPPYMGKENYPGSTGNAYNDRSLWKHFKYRLLETGLLLANGGYMVINVAEISIGSTKYNLPSEFVTMGKKHSAEFQLQYVTTLDSFIQKREGKQSSSEKFILFRRQAILPNVTHHLSAMLADDNPLTIKIKKRTADNQAKNDKPNKKKRLDNTAITPIDQKLYLDKSTYIEIDQDISSRIAPPSFFIPTPATPAQLPNADIFDISSDDMILEKEANHDTPPLNFENYEDEISSYFDMDYIPDSKSSFKKHR